MGLENYVGISLVVIMLSPETSRRKALKNFKLMCQTYPGLGTKHGVAAVDQDPVLASRGRQTWGLVCAVSEICVCARVPLGPLAASPIPHDGPSVCTFS